MNLDATRSGIRAPILTAIAFVASLCAVAAMAYLFSAAGFGDEGVRSAIAWTGSPYLGYCGLAFSHRRDRRASVHILACTILSGLLATLLYLLDLSPFIESESTGAERPMSC